MLLWWLCGLLHATLQQHWMFLLSACAVSCSMFQAFHTTYFPGQKSFTEDTAFKPPCTWLLSRWTQPWSIDPYLESFKISKGPLNHVSHFNIMVLLWFSVLVLGQAQIIGFPNLRLSTLPERFGEIKIFPMQWINIKTIPLTLKMCKTCTEKQLTHCRNWFGPLQLISFGMARLLHTRWEHQKFFLFQNLTTSQD